MASVDNFKKVPVKVPYKSAFDKSYRNTLTGRTGSLIPVLCDELIANSDVYCRVPFVLGMPPLASDTFANINYKLEAFFVPTRLLMHGYERFIEGDTKISYGGPDETQYNLRAPVVWIQEAPAAGTLADYLGLVIDDYDYNKQLLLTAFPFLAYALIYDEWYRASMVTKSIFDDYVTSTWRPGSMKSIYPTDNPNVGYQASLYSDLAFTDGSSLNTIRQRNYGLDYFTTATPNAQNGPAIGVSLSINSSYIDEGLTFNYDSSEPGDSSVEFAPADNAINSIRNSGSGWFGSRDGSNKYDTQYNNTFPNSNNPSGAGVAHNGGFTIASLRAANSLQIFLERNRLAGDRFVDFLKANYGSDLASGVAQRPVYLGSASVPVYVNGVLQTANGGSETSLNPFDTVGSNYGRASAQSKDFVVKFHVDEPGYFFIIGSLVPEVSYSSGIDRQLRRYVSEGSRTDMANHLLQNVGPQPVLYVENNSVVDSNLDKVFGFVDRYADWMTKKNQVHGLMRDGQSLSSFVFQRSFEAPGGISTDFLEIPVDALDGIMAVNDANAGFTYWADFYFDYKVSMPLARYSIPSLQDPAYEHGDTIWLNRGGVRLD